MSYKVPTAYFMFKACQKHIPIDDYGTAEEVAADRQHNKHMSQISLLELLVLSLTNYICISMLDFKLMNLDMHEFNDNMFAHSYVPINIQPSFTLRNDSLSISYEMHRISCYLWDEVLWLNIYVFITCLYIRGPRPSIYIVIP